MKVGDIACLKGSFRVVHPIYIEDMSLYIQTDNNQVIILPLAVEFIRLGYYPYRPYVDPVQYPMYYELEKLDDGFYRYNEFNNEPYNRIPVIYSVNFQLGYMNQGFFWRIPADRNGGPEAVDLKLLSVDDRNSHLDSMSATFMGSLVRFKIIAKADTVLVVEDLLYLTQYVLNEALCELYMV